MTTEVQFRSYSMFVGAKQDSDWYEWCVFVDADPSLVQRIKSVEYTLHPTFPNPMRRTGDKSTRFALFSSGWGGFRILIEIEWEDGTTTKTSHMLMLERENWPTKERPSEFDSAKSERVYDALLHPTFRWRKVATVARITGLTEAEATEVLRQLQTRDLVRKADFHSFEKKEVWAVTAKVGLSPRLD